MAKPGFNYQEPDYCTNCSYVEDYNKETFWCINKKQLKLKGNKPILEGCCIVNSIYVSPFGKCDLYKRKNK